MLNCVSFLWNIESDPKPSDEIGDKAAAQLAEAIGFSTGAPVRSGAFSGCAGRIIGTPPNDVAICVMHEGECSSLGRHKILVWCQEPMTRRVGILRKKIHPIDPKGTLNTFVLNLRSLLIENPAFEGIVWMTEDEMFGSPANKVQSDPWE
jgi:hypothetical protein